MILSSRDGEMEQRLGSLAALQRTQVQLLAPCWAVICCPLTLRFFGNVPIPKLAGIYPFGAATTNEPNNPNEPSKKKSFSLPRYRSNFEEQ